jgi:CheY-like chemotaxis protein
MLLEREGVAVVGIATTSAEALRLEEQLRPDVVPVDIRLGDESGFDLARRLRGDPDLHPRAERVRQGDRGESGGGICPKAQLSASAVLRLAGASTD